MWPKATDIIDNKNGFQFTFQEDGEWIWKAFIPRRQNAKEKPHFKVSEEIEKHYQQDFDKALAQAVKDITKYLVV